MTTVIRKLTPEDIKVERARLLDMARVSDISELQKKQEIWDMTVEEHWVLMRLKSLDFLEGVDSKAS
ncbi:MAG: hypothetical protein RL036_544 [Actinomycetota bacterium]|jgi:hypothetical protein